MKVLNLRNVPDDVYFRFKDGALRSGVTLAEYLAELMRRHSGLE